MIIAPPDELVKYIALNEDGEWIKDPNMPERLNGMFEKFKEDYCNAQEYKKNFR